MVAYNLITVGEITMTDSDTLPFADMPTFEEWEAEHGHLVEFLEPTIADPHRTGFWGDGNKR